MTETDNLRQNVIRLGNEVRVLSDENASLKAEVKRLGIERISDLGMLGDKCAEIASLKDNVERLERLVNYWRIEANVDHDRWLRSLEEIDHIRKLK